MAGAPALEISSHLCTVACTASFSLSRVQLILTCHDTFACIEYTHCDRDGVNCFTYPALEAGETRAYCANSTSGRRSDATVRLTAYRNEWMWKWEVR